MLVPIIELGENLAQAIGKLRKRKESGAAVSLQPGGKRSKRTDSHYHLRRSNNKDVGGFETSGMRKMPLSLSQTRRKRGSRPDRERRVERHFKMVNF